MLSLEHGGEGGAEKRQEWEGHALGPLKGFQGAGEYSQIAFWRDWKEERLEGGKGREPVRGWRQGSGERGGTPRTSLGGEIIRLWLLLR